jgi:hypothetical protein
MTQEQTSAGRSWSRLARKIVVAVVGFSVLAFGVALIVLPGPAVVVIPLGLAILGKEFPWARRLLRPMLRLLRWLKLRAQRWRGPRGAPEGVDRGVALAAAGQATAPVTAIVPGETGEFAGLSPGGRATAQLLGHEPSPVTAIVVETASGSP